VSLLPPKKLRLQPLPPPRRSLPPPLSPPPPKLASLPPVKRNAFRRSQFPKTAPRPELPTIDMEIPIEVDLSELCDDDRETPIMPFRRVPASK